MSNFYLAVHDNVLRSPGLRAVLSHLPSVQASWERSITLDGGYWLGRFVLRDLPEELLTRAFYNWLGHHVVEKTGGISWEGMVYEMTLHGAITRRLSMEEIANRVRPFYHQLVLNPGFETTGTPTFADWQQTITSFDTITVETTNVATGARAAKITNVNHGNTYLYQTLAVTAKSSYRLTFYTRGDGTQGGRYRLYNVSGSSDIVPTTATNITGTNYQQVRVEFTTPPACTSLRLYLYAPAAVGSATYDNVSLQKVAGSLVVGQPGTVVDNVESQAQFGVKETVLEADSAAGAAQDAVQHASLNAWPRLARSPGRTEQPYLEVTCAGYIFTTKWVYTSFSDFGTAYNTNELLDSLLKECLYIQKNIIGNPGSTATIQPGSQPKTVREAMNEVTQTGNASFTPWRLHLTANRTAVFEPLSPTPSYLLTKGIFYHKKTGGSQVNPWQMRPGVVRDMEYPLSGRQAGSWFVDRRDFLLKEVVAGPNGISWSEGAIE